jgi:glycosyltransferase involved in cell wall biosynthesis
MYQYVPWLRRAGIHVTAMPFFEDDYLERRYASAPQPLTSLARAMWRRLQALLTSRRFDLIWIEYELFPWAPGIAESILSLAGIPTIVEYDDAVFHRYDRHPSWLVRATLSRKIDRIMHGAAAVIVGNAYLAARAETAGARHIDIIPSVIDLSRYDGVPPPPPVQAVGNASAMSAPSAAGESTRPLVIGWIGSPSTSPYLHTIAPALRAVCEPGRAIVKLVGTSDAAADFAFPCETSLWDEAREIDDLHGFDIGIMPLPDQPWERGKCGYKLLQYMACGKPVIASPVGANCEIVQPGVNGLLAGTHDEWVAALDTLLRDANLRARYGRAGRTTVEQRYSLDMAAPQLVSILRRTARPTGAETQLASAG